jgi:hypothetical protein
VHGEIGEGLQVGHEHVQQEIQVAGHDVAGAHLGQLAHRGLEGLGDLLGLPLDPHLDESLDLHAQRRRAEHRGIALDHPGFLEPRHAALAGRGRQRHPFGEGDDRQAAVALQFVQDPGVGAVESCAHLFTTDRGKRGE